MGFLIFFVGMPEQVGCLHSLPDDQSEGERADNGSAQTKGGGQALPCILVIGEAALAADLITAFWTDGGSRR